MANIKTYICCFAISLVLTGCARSVTNKNTLLQIDIEIALRGTVGPGDNIAIVFGKTSPPTLPTEYDLYFPLPGQISDTNRLTTSINNLYSSYFNTWKRYILCEIGGPKLYESDGNGFTYTPDTIAPKNTFAVTHNFQSGTNTLKLRFFIGEIAAISGETLFIQILSTRRASTHLPGETAGYFQDSLLAPIVIQLQAGQILQKSPQQEAINSNIPASVDIQAWQVSVF